MILQIFEEIALKTFATNAFYATDFVNSDYGTVSEEITLETFTTKAFQFHNHWIDVQSNCCETKQLSLRILTAISSDLYGMSEKGEWKTFAAEAF